MVNEYLVLCNVGNDFWVSVFTFLLFLSSGFIVSALELFGALFHLLWHLTIPSHKFSPIGGM